MAESSSNSSLPSKKVILRTSDNKEVEVDKHVVMRASTIRRCLEEDVVQKTIPLASIDSKTLEIIIEYLKKHSEPLPEGEDYEVEEAIKAWNWKLVGGLSSKEILDLALAAHYLDIKGLMDLTCEKVADTIKDMSVKDVRNFLGIKNDFTPEEEARIINEHRWAHELDN